MQNMVHHTVVFCPTIVSWMVGMVRAVMTVAWISAMRRVCSMVTMVRSSVLVVLAFVRLAFDRVGDGQSLRLRFSVMHLGPDNVREAHRGVDRHFRSPSHKTGRPAAC